jgi:hypothetical protein
MTYKITHRFDIIECSLTSLHCHSLEHLRSEHHSAQSVPHKGPEYSTNHQGNYLVPIGVIREGGELYHVVQLWSHLPRRHDNTTNTHEYGEEERVVLEHSFHPRST